MKIHRFLSFIIALILFAISTTGVFASTAPQLKWKTSKVKSGYITKFYVNNPHRYMNKMKTSKKLKVKVIDETKVTHKILKHRKNKYILVEKIHAQCIDNNGNGRTSTGYYINYQDCENAFKGQKYITYLVYGNNNCVDDVVTRIDTWN